jgi:hypothetical protein
MTGFLKRLFGSAANENTPPVGKPDEVYKDVEVYAQPQKEGGQWRVAGLLKKLVEDRTVERRFMRADLLPDKEAAATAALGKARLIIDQNGASLWTGEDRMV